MKRSVPPISVVLAAMIMWVSFAWGLPTDAPAAEGEADVAAGKHTWRCSNCDAENDPSAKYCMECGAKRLGEAAAAAEDPWAGVRISDAYDYAKCPNCGKKKEIRAESCSSFTWRGAGYRRCGTEFPQPSAEMTDPDMVFVPGLGYYREGTLVEPGGTKKGYWITGIVLTVSGLTVGGVAGYYGGDVGGAIAALPCLAAIGVGVGLIIYGLIARTEAVYAFTSGERFDPYERPAFTRRPLDSDGAALKIEVTLLSF